MFANPFDWVAAPVPSKRSPPAGFERLLGGSLAIRRLRNGAGPIQEEDSDLFVGDAADVHRAMNSVHRFIPVNLPRRDRDVIAGTLVPVFDDECVTAEDYGDSMEGIPVPRCRCARREAQPSHERMCWRNHSHSHAADHPLAFLCQ